VIGDFDLVVSQVKGKFNARGDRLRSYKDAIWDIINSFDAFSIKAVPREQNTQADALVVAASTS
jgi:hypothetical protein